MTYIVADKDSGERLVPRFTADGRGIEWVRADLTIEADPLGFLTRILRDYQDRIAKLEYQVLVNKLEDRLVPSAERGRNVANGRKGRK